MSVYKEKSGKFECFLKKYWLLEILIKIWRKTLRKCKCFLAVFRLEAVRFSLELEKCK